uniref:non-specific serine/threonine protein kinase n=1 Tax=Lotharella globosa TaxID=91324 RepID=A0A6V3K2P5_9EUKA|mmetsp:Transcript_37119/g.71617  ORF Transcript_37119/g.71617 Transcript_37119/m.71617 type:complete len:186 (+) Transcript_37119:84-641(+)
MPSHAIAPPLPAEARLRVFEEVKTLVVGQMEEAPASWRLVKSTEDTKAYLMKIIFRMEPKGLKELRMLQAMRHPFVLQIKEYFSDAAAWGAKANKAARLWIVLRPTAEALSSVVEAKARSAHFPEPTLLNWLAQLVLAVDYFHSKAIVHQRLSKIQSFFVSKSGTIHIGDLQDACVCDPGLFRFS